MKIIKRTAEKIKTIENIYLKSLYQILFYGLVILISGGFAGVIIFIVAYLYTQMLWLFLILCAIGLYIYIVVKNSKTKEVEHK